jgi:hypothetical protein
MSSLKSARGNDCRARQIHNEYAALAGQVARIKPPVVRFRAPSAEREAKTHAGPIGASLLEGTKQLLQIPAARKAAAFVMDLDQDAIGASTNL